MQSYVFPDEGSPSARTTAGDASEAYRDRRRSPTAGCLSRLGRGAVGQVYLAKDTKFATKSLPWAVRQDILSTGNTGGRGRSPVSNAGTGRPRRYSIKHESA